MDAGIRAGREQIARNRLIELCQKLASELELDPFLVESLQKANHRDPLLKGLFQTEALVPVLEGAVNQLDGLRAKVEEIGAGYRVSAEEATAETDRLKKEHAAEVKELKAQIAELEKGQTVTFTVEEAEAAAPTRGQIAEIVLEIPGLTKTSKEAIQRWAKEAEQTE